MLHAIALAGLLAPSPHGSRPAPCPPDRVGSEDDGLRAIYEGGRSYTSFLEEATRQVDLWQTHTEKSEGIDTELVRRARAAGGTWRFLAVAVDSCSDSVSTIPYLARLVALVDGLDMRIVDSTVGRAIMEAHPTGRVLHRAPAVAPDVDPREQRLDRAGRDLREQDGLVRGGRRTRDRREHRVDARGGDAGRRICG